MEIKDFIEKFVDAIEVEDVEVTPSTEFHLLDEWSSLAGLSLIAMVDEEYDVALKGEDIKASITIQDLFDKVCSLKA